MAMSVAEAALQVVAPSLTPDSYNELEVRRPVAERCSSLSHPG